MKITLIGNSVQEHLHVPGAPGITERDGGPVHVAQQALAVFPDVEVCTISSVAPSWVDVHLEDGGEPTVVTNAPLRIRGMQDAAAFLILPVAEGEFNFDQLELLGGKVAVSAAGLTRVLNSRERRPLAIPERFLPLIDVLLLPYDDRHLVPEEVLKELKRHRVLILTRGDTGADLYDHGAKHSLPSIQGLPLVLAPNQDACFLATFIAHWVRTKEPVLSLNFAAEAVAARLRDAEALPVTKRPHPSLAAAGTAEEEPPDPPLLASTGGATMHVTFDPPPVASPAPPATYVPQEPQAPQDPPAPPAPGQMSIF